MFIEQYKLESNPFVADAARPIFASHSMRYATRKLDDLLNKQIHCLFLSGPAGAGKTTLVRQRFRTLRDEGILYALRLLQAGVQVELHSYPGTFHGATAIMSAEVSRRAAVESFGALRRGLQAR